MSEEHKIPFFDDYGVTDGNLRKAYDELELYVSAGRPLIYIQSLDFAVVDSMVAKIARSNPSRQMKIVEYIDEVGVVSFDGKEKDDNYKNIIDLKSFLLDYINSVGRWDSLEKTPHPIILLLKNVHRSLEKEPEIQSFLRQLALVSMREHGDLSLKTFVYVIVVSSELYIPAPLERLMALVNVQSPNKEEIKKHVNQLLEDLTFRMIHENNGYDKILSSRMILGDEGYDRILSPLLGLTMVEIDQVMSQILTDCIPLESPEAQKAIMEEKRKLVQKSGLLKIVNQELEEQEVGGLFFLNEYLQKEAAIYNLLESAKKAKIEIPKGVLIVGMPGCGKTLMAKLAAKKFNSPLICLDIGRLMGQYVGQSEENMRRALAMVESVAPCVLWIDELEKAFSGVGFKGSTGGSEVSTRLFGYFLTWMQEKRDSVYVIATANRISHLPPELLRRGRFDEIFRVDLPSEDEQEEIYKVQLKRRGIDSSNIKFREKTESGKDVWSLTKDGFCGADIAAVVGRAIKNVFRQKSGEFYKKRGLNNQKDITIQLAYKDIEEELKKQAKDMTPLKDTLVQDISEITTTLNKYKFLNARDGTVEKTKKRSALKKKEIKQNNIKESQSEKKVKQKEMQSVLTTIKR